MWFGPVGGKFGIKKIFHNIDCNDFRDFLNTVQRWVHLAVFYFIVTQFFGNTLEFLIIFDSKNIHNIFTWAAIRKALSFTVVAPVRIQARATPGNM